MRSLVCASLVVLLLAVACATKSTPPSSASNPPAAAAAPPATPAPAPPPPSASTATHRGGRGPRRRAPAPRPQHRHPPPRQAAAAEPAAGRGGGRGRGGPPPPPPPPPPAVMPAPVTPIVSATAPSPDPRVGLSPGRWDAGQAAWNIRLVSTTPPSPKFLGVTNSDLAFTGKYAIQGNYNGFQIFDITTPEKPHAGADVCLPGVAERRVGLQEPAVRVGRRPDRAYRLRHPGCARAGQQGSPARHSHLRHFGHGQSEVHRQRADLPRLAHAHGRHRSARQGQRLHLCVRFGRRPLGGRAARLLRRRDRRSEKRALPPRSDSRAARGAAEGGDRELAAHLLRPRSATAARRAGARRCARLPAPSARVRWCMQRRAELAAAGGAAPAWRRSVAGGGGRGRCDAAAGRISATTSPSIPTSGSPAARAAGTGCCSTSARWRTRSASTKSPTSTCRSGTRRRSATTAPRCCSPTSGAAARSRAAATPTSRSGAPTRSSRSRRAR